MLLKDRPSGRLERKIIDQATSPPLPETALSKQTAVREKSGFRSKAGAIYEMINSEVLNHRIKCSGIRPEGVLTVTNPLGIPRQIKAVA